MPDFIETEFYSYNLIPVFLFYTYSSIPIFLYISVICQKHKWQNPIIDLIKYFLVDIKSVTMEIIM